MSLAKYSFGFADRFATRLIFGLIDGPTLDEALRLG